MAGVVNPASPEGMLRSYYGGDATGLSSVKDKPEDDRSILEQVRNYLTTGINEDARYALGPNAAPAVTGLGSLLGELVGPGADVRDAVTASGETTQAVKEGDILGAGVGGLNTLASLAMMALPGSLGGAKKIGSELADSRVTERLFHGTPNPDIKKLKPSKEGVLGDGVYLTPDPKYASNYAEGDTGNVIPAFAKIQNPLRIKHSNNDPSSAALIALGVPEEKAFKIVEKAFEEKGNITKEISSRARKQGYDSIILENKDGSIQEIVSYRPDNIYPTTDSAENISKETQNFVDRMLEKDIYSNDPEFYKLKKEFIEDVEKVSPEKDKISVFPKPERMFPEGQRPKGGAKKIGREVSEELIPAKPLGVGVDENLISGKAIKNYTSNDFNILDDLISQGKANAGTKKANKLLDAPVEEGANVGVRLNLNSKIEDTPENLKPMLQTLHKNSASGKALSYKPYATVVATDKKKVKFYVSPKGREDIATGNKAKYPAMSVNGAYDPNLKILPNDPDVVEVGFNPKAHHLFVDLNTGQAVKEADAATIIGDRVYAKGITYFKKSEAPKPKAKSQVRYKEKKKGGSVVERNPYANYQPKAI